MFAQLGTYIFEGLQAPGSFSESGAAKYGRISLINSKDVLQKTGDDLREITLTILYSINFCSPAEEIEKLRTSMQTGEVLPFIMGDGSVVGKFVIGSIDTQKESFTPDGVIETARLTVSLLEYVGGEEIKVTGKALKSADPVLQIPVPPSASPAASITADISEAKNNVSRLKQLADSGKNNISAFKKKTHEVRKLSNDTKQLYTSAKTKVEATGKIIDRARNLPGSLDEAIGYAENLAKLDNTTDFTVIEENINALSGSADKVGVNASHVVAFGLTKEGGN